jgi:flagellar basal body P-ring formation protein FlgA
MARLKLFSLLALVALLLGANLSAQTPASPTAGPLSEEQLSDDLEQLLTAHFNLDGELQLQLLRPWSPPQLLAKNWVMEITDYPQVATSSMLLRCRLLADGVPAGDYTLTMKAMLWGDGWAARQRLAHGATFDPVLLDARRVDFFRDREVLPASVGDNSFIFERSVNAGRLLTWRDIKRRPLVRKGEVVEVSATDGMLVITMKAIALQNGAQGEAVIVRNQDSRRDFTAFVVDESRVQVRF